MRHSRRGFSIIELMVILAIIAFLVAVLVPAVQKVREAAARTQSSNNLKQLALAFHNFHDTFKVMPFNGSDKAVGNAKYQKAAKNEDFMSGSWAFQILPYIEQDNHFKNIDRAAGIPTFLCPGRGRPAVETSNGGGAWSDYYYNNYLNDPLNADKFDAADKKCTFATIIDGTSNTIMLGHGNINTTQYKSAADVTLCINIYSGGTAGTARAGDATKQNKRDDPGGVTLQRDNDKAPGIGSWGGPFPQGALFALCDGSVRMTSYSFGQLNRMLTPDGGEVIMLD